MQCVMGPNCKIVVKLRIVKRRPQESSPEVIIDASSVNLRAGLPGVPLNFLPSYQSQLQREQSLTENGAV